MNLLTRRMPTILGLLLLVGAVVGSIYYYQSVIAKVLPEIIPTKVRIANISDNKFSVSWSTTAATYGSIEYGTLGDKLTTIVKDERDESSSGQYFMHQVTVEKLQPSTQYAFRILSGTKPTRFDNSGSPYTASTGPVIGATPTSHNFYGKVQLASKQAASDSIVYIALPGAAPASTLVRDGGNYAFTLSTIRTADLRNFVTYDPAASVASVSVESGRVSSICAVSLANSAPVPTITLGQNTDFLNKPETPDVAEVAVEKVGIFNVEPIASPGAINIVGSGEVVILNPKEVGEILTTLRPEFRGTGPADLTLSIALTGQKAISDTVKIAKDGTWSWAPVIDLKVGKQKIAVSYIPPGEAKKTIEREFVISNSQTLEPAFVASPSATSTTGGGKASSTPRAAMPATGSGVPVTGVIEDTLLTLGIGAVIMVVGAALLAL